MSETHEFEEARRCLLNSYHSYVQNHAGYLIAIIIGSLTLISHWDSFFSSPRRPVSPIMGWSFFIMLIAIGGVTVYVIIRFLYWTGFAGSVAFFRKEDAYKSFLEYCKKNEQIVKKYYEIYLNEQKIKKEESSSIEKWLDSYPSFLKNEPCTFILNCAVRQHLEVSKTYRDRITVFPTSWLFVVIVVLSVTILLVLWALNLRLGFL